MRFDCNLHVKSVFAGLTDSNIKSGLRGAFIMHSLAIPSITLIIHERHCLRIDHELYQRPDNAIITDAHI